MKTKFLNQFYKDIDKKSGQSVCSDVIKAIRNIEVTTSPGEIKGLKKPTE